MQASHKRQISSGGEYSRYFDLSKLQRKDPILKKSGTGVFDTIVEMARIVRKTLPDTEKVAPVLQGATLEATCRNIFDFVYNHIQYTLDKPGVEQLRRPLRAWADRVAGVDCDCYSIFISSILTNLGIDHYFRMTKYKADWQHIYIVVPKEPGKAPKGGNYYTIDCVVDRYDYEVPFSDKHDKKMSALQYLDGVSGIGNVSQPGFGAEFIDFGNASLSGYLGATDSAEGLYFDFLERLKLHLENTLAQLKANPNALPPGSKLKTQIEQVLKVWYQPEERDALIDAMAAEEIATGLSGVDGLGGVWDRIKKGVQKASGFVAKNTTKAVKAVGTGVSNAAKWTGNKASDSWKGVKQAAEWTFEKVVQLNPLSVAMRNGLLLAFKLNLFRMAERLGYGYLTEQQALAKGLHAGEFRKVKEKLNNVHKLWKGLQGDESSLRKNILQGWERGVKKRGNVSGFGSTPAHSSYLGEVVTATAGTAAATPLIVKIVDWLKEVNWAALFQGVKVLTDKPQNTSYEGVSVPNGYELPTSEEAFNAKGGTPGESDNTLLYAGLGVAAVVAIIVLSK
ncbi:hypothetical protein ACFS7Z_13810 [Pontibacter toksunensis]|uniref:Transglutaminase-like domain-containing protein n=1 Tax=Pontibacter toksunensis TaxID=1332631 RepID=A0ABW6BZG8_9BACT